MGSPSANPKDHVKGVEGASCIFAEHEGFIRAVIRYHVKDEARADDLFQDFFLYLISKPVPPGVQNIRSYLYRMITNYIAEAIHRTEKYQARIQRYTERLKHSTSQSKPENSLIAEEETAKMFELIEGRLQPRHAEAITLRYRNNYNIKQVAEKMHVTKESVSRYISVGISKARQFLTSRKSR
ncbi:MAG: RNA polymerase sigma factor [bacterium]